MLRLKRLLGWTSVLCLSFLLYPGCSPHSTGSAALDRVINSDYGTWEGAVGPRIPFYEKELERLNPHYGQASRESLTLPLQRVILSLLALQKKEGVIVELGSWTGGGVLLMAPHLTHDRRFHAVDTFNADAMPDDYIRGSLKGRKQLEVFQDNIAAVKHKVVVHQGLTKRVAASWPRDLTIDLLFIDADHSYKGVSEDWKNWNRFVKKGGVIAFHDYYRTSVRPESGYQGLRRFVDETIVPRAGKDFHFVWGLAWYIVR